MGLQPEGHFVMIVKVGPNYYGTFETPSEAVAWVEARQRREWPGLSLEFSVIELQVVA